VVVNEPRGSDVLVGALLCEPTDPASAAGVIFFNNVGYLGMCGHGTIGLVVSLAHLGRISAGVHRIDTPVGVVAATLHPSGKVTVENVPSAPSTADAVALAKAAADAGCDGLTVLPPYVYRSDWRETKAHMAAVFNATPLSCMLYNNRVALVFYILTVFGIFRLRKTRPLAERPYKTWGYPWLPGLYIAGAAVILLVLFVYRPETTWPGMAKRQNFSHFAHDQLS